MALRIPKHTDIRNPRLLGLYYIVMLFMLTGFATFFFTSQQWAREVSAAGHVHVNMWVTGIENPTLLWTSWEKMRTQSKICTAPTNYDYWWSSDTVHHYDDHICPPLCPAGPAFGCVSLLETFFQEDPSRLFIVTELQEAYLNESSSFVGFKPKNIFVPSAENLGIGLQYRLSVPAPSTFSSSGSTGAAFKGGKQQLVTGTSGMNITTIIVGAKGETWKTLGPSNQITLTVPDLLTLAGNADALDTPLPAGGANMKPGALLRGGPIGRIMGMELTVEIDCYDGPQRGEQIQRSVGTQLVCYLAVRDNFQSWSSQSRIDLISGSGESRSRNYHGIRVKFESGGYLRFVSVAKILLNVTSALVLLSLPNRFVLFFATTCLGRLSEIYKEAIYERLDLKAEVGGITTRLMTSSAAFVQLGDVQVTPNGGTGISRKRMGERLQEVLRKRSTTLDPHEVEQLVDYCFKSVTSGKKSRTAFQLIADEVSGLFKEEKETEMKVSQCIDIDAFSVACTSNEKISLATVVDWFDADRALTCLENLFTPYDVKKYVLRSAKFRKTLETVGQTESAKSMTNLTPKASSSTKQGNDKTTNDPDLFDFDATEKQISVMITNSNGSAGGMVSLEQERENNWKMQQTVAGLLKHQQHMQDEFSSGLEELKCRMRKFDEELSGLYKLVAENKGLGLKFHEEVQSVKESISHWEGESKNTQALADEACNLSSHCENFITTELPQIMDQFRTEFESKLLKLEEACTSVSRNAEDCHMRQQAQVCAPTVGLVSSKNYSAGKLSQVASKDNYTGTIACDNSPHQMTSGLAQAMAQKETTLPTKPGLTKGIVRVPSSGKLPNAEHSFGWARTCVMRDRHYCQ